MQLDRHLDRIERIAIALNDERSRRDARQRGRREAHVVVAFGQRALVPPEGRDLLIAMRVALAQPQPFRVGGMGRDLPHDAAGLLGEVHRGAHHDHRVDAYFALQGRLQRGMQERVAAHAQADRLAPLEAELIEEREQVARALRVAEGLVGVRGVAVSARVDGDHPVATREVLETRVTPVAAASGHPVQQEERLALAVHFVGEVDAVQLHGSSRFAGMGRVHGKGLRFSSLEARGSAARARYAGAVER